MRTKKSKSLVLLWCFSFTWCGASAQGQTRKARVARRCLCMNSTLTAVSGGIWISVGWIQSHEHLIFDTTESICHPKVGRTILFLSFSLVSGRFVSPVLKFFIFYLIVQEHLESVRLVCEPFADFANCAKSLEPPFSAEKGVGWSWNHGNFWVTLELDASDRGEAIWSQDGSCTLAMSDSFTDIFTRPILLSQKLHWAIEFMSFPTLCFLELNCTHQSEKETHHLGWWKSGHSLCVWALLIPNFLMLLNSSFHLISSSAVLHPWFKTNKKMQRWWSCRRSWGKHCNDSGGIDCSEVDQSLLNMHSEWLRLSSSL